MTSVLDYGAGNLRSVTNTLDALGSTYQVTNQADDLRQATKIILPGVGHFGQMMQSLEGMQVREVLVECVRSGIPFLGICLGMHALFEASDEAPDSAGLGIFPGRVLRFPSSARVPHMGWNQVEATSRSRLLARLPNHSWFYFAHSYYIPANEVTAGSCDYSVTYSAVVESENVFGVQFHPEKSGDTGQQLVRSFLEL